MNQEEIEKAIKEVLKDGESYDLGEICSSVGVRELEGIICIGVSLIEMEKANKIASEEVIKYFLTEDNPHEK